MFWILNSTFWLFFIVRELFAVRYYEPAFTEFYFLASITYLTGFSVSLLVRLLFICLISRMPSLLRMALMFASVLIMASVVWRFLDALISYPFWSEPIRMRYAAFSWMDHIMETFQYLLTLLVWGAVYFIVFLFDRLFSQQVRTQEAENLAIQARFQLLQNQLNPHFLFNSLNSIRALIFENQQKAADLVTDLSGFLRYNLQQSGVLTIPLQEEIEAIRTYLSIEQKRYEGDLQVTVEMDHGCTGIRVIPNLLLPLVDNAVKHGMQTSAMPLKVGIVARMSGKGLYLEVSNTGRWNSGQHREGGVGLNNVRERLQNRYGERFTMEIDQEPVLVRVIIHLPESRDEQA